MSIYYFVTERSTDGKYGIAGVDVESRHSAVTMPFLPSKTEAVILASVLTQRQATISAFRDMYLFGDLRNLLILENM